MKHINYFSIIIIGSLFFLNSCEGEPLYETDAVRRISNKTDYLLEIKAFGDIGDTIKFSLAPQSSIDIEGKCYTGVEDYCDIGWMDLGYGSIQFNNERIQKFASIHPLGCGGNKAVNDSVRGNCGYELIVDTETLQIFEYQVTDTDYQNAEIL